VLSAIAKDQGRFETTKQEVDRMMFKVPSLRNIAETAPYSHDGSIPTLALAVRRMGKHQLGLNLSDNEVELIMAWRCRSPRSSQGWSLLPTSN
jgi:cytochrome c peroxidase